MKIPPIRKAIHRVTVAHLILSCLLLAAAGAGWLLALLNWQSTWEGMLHDLRWFIIGVAYGLGVPAFGAWNLVRSVRWLRDPDSHPALQWPEVGPPAAVAAAVDGEVQSGEVIEVRPAVFTRSWMLRFSDWGVDTALLSSIVWVYKQVTQHRTYGIPTGKTYAVQVWTRDGKGLSLDSVPEKQVDALMEHLNGRVPWALFGYTQEMERQWRSNRAVVLEAVDQRRAAGLENAALP